MWFFYSRRSWHAAAGMCWTQLFSLLKIGNFKNIIIAFLPGLASGWVIKNTLFWVIKNTLFWVMKNTLFLVIKKCPILFHWVIRNTLFWVMKNSNIKIFNGSTPNAHCSSTDTRLLRLSHILYANLFTLSDSLEDRNFLGRFWVIWGNKEGNEETSRNKTLIQICSQLCTIPVNST